MTQTAKKQYNYCMDFLKGIACIFVVFIHVKFPGNLGQSVQAIARFAVPFFFMVSGYYCYCKDYQGVIGGGKKILHIFKITFFAYIFYLIVAMLENALFDANNSFDFTWPHIVGVALSSVPSNIPAQLWFLIALLEVYIIYFFIDLLKVRTFAYVLGLVMLVALSTLSEVAWLFGYDFNPALYRNGIVEGFGFFMLGYFLHNKEDMLSISNKTLVVVIILSAICSIIDRFLCGRVFGVHLCTYPLVTSLFIYAIKNKEKHAGEIQRIGMKYSMYVYILHIMVWHEFDRFLEIFKWNENMVIMSLRPLFVLGITLLLSIGCYVLFNKKKVLTKSVATN